MTKITIDRAVVGQALVGLEAACGGRCNAEYNPCWQRQMADAFRAALAEDALQRLTDVQQDIEAALAEPVPPIGKASTDVGVPVYVLKKAEPPCNKSCAPGYCYCEPVQEPFGYLWPTGRHPEFRFTQQKRDGVDGMPLYTSPPQRKPLTEKEIIDLWADIARAVEAAHGIKEEK